MWDAIHRTIGKVLTLKTMKRKEMTRQKCIALIDARKKRARFIEGWDRTPEVYFDEYAYKEPDIWFDVLNDLSIDWSK